MTLSRRHFLLAAAGGVAATAASSIAGESSASAAPLPAEAAFTKAARATGVPASVLAAFSWAQTRWGDHEDRPSIAGGYGPMHLIDGSAARATVSAAAGKPVDLVDTLGEAATASGLGKQKIRTDPQANIMAAAALIAARQKALKQPTTATDPASWYLAVADAAGLTSPEAQVDFADQVMLAARQGVTHEVVAGTRVSMTAVRVGSTSAQRTALANRAAAGPQPYPIDAPTSVKVDWIPAAYKQLSSDPTNYGNHDLKPNATTPRLRYVVIHDTENTYKGATDAVQNATYLGWHYTVRSSDGRVAEHLRASQAMGWHAGNWYINQHSIGVEHEGRMTQGYSWYSEPMYRASALLVGYLCREYGIPMDRAHIIGHDMVPGGTSSSIPDMHVDPGPYWDWEHYFELLGAPFTVGTHAEVRRNGPQQRVVRIIPHFATNKPVVTLNGRKQTTRSTNFLPVHLAPQLGAPLVRDIGMHPSGQYATTDAYDMASRATAGQEYVTIERQGDWLAIWFLGQKGWIYDPASSPRTRVVTRARVVRPLKGQTVHTFGRCYPEASAYPKGIPAQTVSSLPYVVGAGQAYVVTDPAPITDYYRAKTFSLKTPNDHIDIVGTTKYLQISYGPRVAYVRADQVSASDIVS